MERPSLHGAGACPVRGIGGVHPGSADFRGGGLLLFAEGAAVGEGISVAGGLHAARLQHAVGPQASHIRVPQFHPVHGGGHGDQCGHDGAGGLSAFPQGSGDPQSGDVPVHVHHAVQRRHDSVLHAGEEPAHAGHHMGSCDAHGALGVEPDHHPHLFPVNDSSGDTGQRQRGRMRRFQVPDQDMHPAGHADPGGERAAVRGRALELLLQRDDVPEHHHQVPPPAGHEGDPDEHEHGGHVHGRDEAA